MTRVKIFARERYFSLSPLPDWLVNKLIILKIIVCAFIAVRITTTFISYIKLPIFHNRCSTLILKTCKCLPFSYELLIFMSSLLRGNVMNT
jgi:hypothetical protein